MATNTFSKTINNADWTLAVDGATATQCGIQIDPSSVNVCVAVATAKPALTSDDFLVLYKASDPSSIIPLSSTDKVYVRGTSTGNVKVRGYSVGR